MSDVIFIAATIFFFAICALYVRWCDKIIGPDDFPASGDAAIQPVGEDGALLAPAIVGAKGEVRQ